MKKSIFITAVCLLSFCTPLASLIAADVQAPTGVILGSSGRVAEVSGGEYRLQPGDVIHIQILNPDWQYLSGDVLVQPDGGVKLATRPTATIAAAGLTQTQFERKAETAFGRMFRDAALIVTMKSAAQYSVFLFGSFAKDGAYPMSGTLRALDALALAGGAPNGDLSKVVLTQGQSTRNLNLERALRTGDPRENAQLKPNAVLYVPEMRNHITVEGQVTIPKNLDYKEGMGILEAIAASNGPTAFADRAHVRVVHANGRQITVDLQKITEGTQNNIILQPDDVVTVLEVGHVLVQGQVTTPKNVQLKPDMTLEQAIAEAGGPKDRANESSVRIDHKDGTSQIVDLLKKQQTYGKDNTLLQPDDVITVPEQLDVTVQGQVALPKNILFIPGMTLTQAVTAAGGSTDKANNTQVVIVSHDGQRRVIDWNKITSTGGADPILQPGDTVTVPEQLEHILVSGEVNKPVVIPFRENLTLDTALALAGGTTPQADLSHVKLQHINGNNVEATNVDMLTIQQDPNATTNKHILQPGDTITVPQQNAQVFVTGQVNRAGAVQYRPGMTLVEALNGVSSTVGPSNGLPQGAGGLTDKADLYSAKLTHHGQTMDIDLDKLLNHGDNSQNVVLEPGDTLYVPESQRRVYVFGAVAKPGYYVIRDINKNRVLDVLQLAGGETPTAQDSKAVIAHAGSNGEIQSTPVHLDLILRKSEMQYNVPLNPGDVLYVPERNTSQQGSTLLGTILGPLLYLLPRL